MLGNPHVLLKVLSLTYPLIIKTLYVVLTSCVINLLCCCFVAESVICDTITRCLTFLYDININDQPYVNFDAIKKQMCSGTTVPKVPGCQMQRLATGQNQSR